VVPAAARARGRRELAGRVDLRRIYLLQAVRAAAYGFGSVILGASLARGGLGTAQVGLVLGSLLAGSALASIGLARRADRLGRRRVYAILYGLMAVGGAVFVAGAYYVSSYGLPSLAPAAQPVRAQSK